MKPEKTASKSISTLTHHGGKGSKSISTSPHTAGTVQKVSEQEFSHQTTGGTTVKISKTYPYNLRNDSHFQFYTEFRNLVQSQGAENLKIAAQFEAWLPQLETRNNAFAELMRDRFDETASRTDIVLKEARLEVDAAYFAIRERINALVIVEGPAAYESFIRTLNAVISKYTRLTKPKGGKNGEETEPETTQTNGGV